MTVPIYITAAILAVFIAYCSDKSGRRSPFIIGPLLIMAAGFSVCLATDPTKHPKAVYAGVYVAVCATYPAFPGVVTWLSNNLSGSLKRSAGMALQIGIGNLGGVSLFSFSNTKLASTDFETRLWPQTFTAQKMHLVSCSDTAWSLLSLVLDCWQVLRFWLDTRLKTRSGRRGFSEAPWKHIRLRSCRRWVIELSLSATSIRRQYVSRGVRSCILILLEHW